MDNIQIKCLSDFNTKLRIKGFNVYHAQNDSYFVHSYHRRLFFKICMDTGPNTIHFADRSYEVNGTVLLIAPPQVPYVWESNTCVSDGYACLFTEQFLHSLGIPESSYPTLLNGRIAMVYELDKNRKELFLNLFKSLTENTKITDVHYHDLMRRGIRYLLHEAQTIPHALPAEGKIDAKERISMVFTDFLERQFPLDNNGEILKYTDIVKYAKAMSISPEELNTAVYHVMQRYPSELYHQRLMTEAHNMLSVHNKDHNTVARQLGFNNIDYFMHSYQKWTKESCIIR